MKPPASSRSKHCVHAVLTMACCAAVIMASGYKQALGSELCGPKVVSERYVELEHRVDSPQLLEAWQLPDGGSVRLKIISQTKTSDTTYFDYGLEFQGGSTKRITGGKSQKEEGHWHILGVHPSGKLLVSSTGYGLESELLIINQAGAIIARHKSKDMSNLSSSMRVLPTSDGDLLLLGSSNHGGVILKISGNGEISRRSQFLSDWGEIHISKSLALADESNILLINGYVKREGGLVQQSAAVRLSNSGDVVWTQHYTHGFGDELSDIVLLPNNELVFAGITHLKHRYDDGNRYFWLFKTDLAGVISDERLFKTHHAVGTQDGSIAIQSSGEILAIWPVWGPKMNDLQYQECTYSYESSDTYVAPTE